MVPSMAPLLEVSRGGRARKKQRAAQQQTQNDPQPHEAALMGRTLPFILLSIAVYAGIAIAYVLATGLGAGLGWSIGGVGGPEARSSGARA